MNSLELRLRGFGMRVFVQLVLDILEELQNLQNARLALSDER